MAASIWQPDGVVHALGAREIIQVACSDLVTNLIVATSVGYFYVAQRCGFTLQGVEASLNQASSSGIVTIDINKNGVTILSTKLTIDQGELTSITAATPAVITATEFNPGDLVTIDIDTAGTAARGLIVTLRGNFNDSTLT